MHINISQLGAQRHKIDFLFCARNSPGAAVEMREELVEFPKHAGRQGEAQKRDPPLFQRFGKQFN
jgi:hypothetical protein